MLVSSTSWSSLAVALLRAEPATMSKRNRRHSIGPFHIGTRRDSFSRMRAGSLGRASAPRRSSRRSSSSSARPAGRRSRRRPPICGAARGRRCPRPAMPPASMRSPYGGLSSITPGVSLGGMRCSASPPRSCTACGDAGALGVALREVDHAEGDVAAEDRRRRGASGGAAPRPSAAAQSCAWCGSSRSKPKRAQQPGRDVAGHLRRLDGDGAAAAAGVVQRRVGASQPLAAIIAAASVSFSGASPLSSRQPRLNSGSPEVSM